MIAPAPAPERRRALRAALASGALLRFPGAFAPIVAKLIERQGFDGAYVSGAALAADLGLPDIGLVTQSEVVARAQAIARTCTLPVIVDVDTGFGSPLNAARTIALLEEAGLAGCHIEDQEAPKRCGHLERKTLVPTPEMVRRVRAAAEAQTDADFLLIARTDARAPEGLAKAIDRAKAYVDAGCRHDLPRGAAGRARVRGFSRGARRAAHGQHDRVRQVSPALRNTLAGLGYNLVIYPVTTFRLAMKAVEDGLRDLDESDDQPGLVPRMMTRAHLYDIVDYAGYGRFDSAVRDFSEE